MLIGNPTPTTAYWTGKSARSGATLAGPHEQLERRFRRAQTDTHQVPGDTTDVYLAASTASNLATTLDADYTIQSLHMSAATTSPASIDGQSTLTILGGGITQDAGAGGLTITSSGLALGLSQTWTNNSTNPLTVTSLVSGSGGLFMTGSGTIVLGGPTPNTFVGPVTLDSGITLQLAGGAAAAANPVAFTADSSGTLQLNGNSVSIGGLSAIRHQRGRAQRQFHARHLKTITVTGASTYAGVIQDDVGGFVSPNGNGPLSLATTGGGMLLLASTNNNFSGGVSLGGGTLAINGAGSLGGTGSLGLMSSLTVNAGVNPPGQQSDDVDLQFISTPSTWREPDARRHQFQRHDRHADQ